MNVHELKESIVKVTAKKIGDGYEYIAHHSNGTSEVVHKAVTRFYWETYLYDSREGVPSDNPHSAYFTFEKNPRQFDRRCLIKPKLLATYRVREE